MSNSNNIKALAHDDENSGFIGLFLKKKVIIAIAVLLFFVNLISLAYTYVHDKLNLIDIINGNKEWVVSGTIADEDKGLIDSNSDVVIPDEDIYSQKGVINILLLGTDERGDKFSNSSRADAMLLLSLNSKRNSIKLISLERAMMVEMPNGNKDLLTHSFHYGGPEWVIDCVEKHLRVDVDNYVRINFHMFEKMVDAVGGVDITLTSLEAQALNQEVNTNTFPLSRRVRAGENHLSGFEALQYCRLRYIDSDFVRIKRQRTTIVAIQEQCRDMSLKDLNSLADKILPMVQTDMSESAILSLIVSLPQYLSSEIEEMTVPVKGTYQPICKNVDYKENARLLRNFIYGETDGEKG